MPLHIIYVGEILDFYSFSSSKSLLMAYILECFPGNTPQYQWEHLLACEQSNVTTGDLLSFFHLQRSSLADELTNAFAFCMHMWYYVIYKYYT